jgi:hypothetical protein
MISDRDIWATAKMLVDHHGAEAPIHAAMRADAMLERGDVDGQAVWKRILYAVEEFQHLPDLDVSETGDAALRTIAEHLIEMFDADASRYALDRAARSEAAGRSEAALIWRATALVVDELKQGRRGAAIH